MTFLSYNGLLEGTVPEVGDEAEIWLHSARCIATGKITDRLEDGRIIFLVTSPLVMSIEFLDVEDFANSVGDA